MRMSDIFIFIDSVRTFSDFFVLTCRGGAEGGNWDRTLDPICGRQPAVNSGFSTYNNIQTQQITIYNQQNVVNTANIVAATSM